MRCLKKTPWGVNMVRFFATIFFVILVAAVLANCSLQPKAQTETKTYAVRVTDETVFASPAEKLATYEQNVYMVSAGMCDTMRTSIVRFKGNDVIGIEEMTMVAPVSGKIYYSVKRVSGKKEFFIKTNVNGKVIVEQKPNAMEWSVSLMQESPNYFLYHFFGKEQPNDCSESKQ